IPLTGSREGRGDRLSVGSVLATDGRRPALVATIPRGTGGDIPIEYRSPNEVTHIGKTPIAPVHTAVYNPAFDVTPAKYITGFITERGIISPGSIIRHF
ncbi:MAG: hypothetical protein QME16_08100, partial [Planctomycetota bacterium]|nr:hypothetical protein [Planctomycetota bacterium]